MKLEIDINFRAAGDHTTSVMLAHIHDKLHEILEVLSTLSGKVDIMAETVATLNEKVNALEAAIDAERAEVLAALQALKGLATQGDLDALGVRLDAEIAKTQGIITDADK